MPTDDHTSVAEGRARANDRAPRLGRRIGLAVYLAILGYMVIVGFTTFIQGIFFDTARADTSTAPCATVRSELASSLRAHASRHAAGGVDDSGAYFGEFDRRVEELRSRCDDSETERLERLRHRVELTLHRFDLENADAFERFGAVPSPLSNEETPR